MSDGLKDAVYPYPGSKVRPPPRNSGQPLGCSTAVPARAAIIHTDRGAWWCRSYLPSRAIIASVGASASIACVTPASLILFQWK